MTKYVDVSPLELLEGRLLPSDASSIPRKLQDALSWSSACTDIKIPTSTISPLEK